VRLIAWSRRYGDGFPAEIALAFVGGAAAFGVAALVSTAARSRVPGAVLGLVLLLAVGTIAQYGGILYALPVGVVSVQAFDWYFLRPLREFDAATVFVLGLFLVVSVLIGAVATISGRRARRSEAARLVLADEQAALKRVATLVARQAALGAVFAAVAEEVGRLLRVEVTHMFAFDDDGTATVVAGWSEPDVHLAVGARRTLADGPGAPIVVDGRLWGVVVAGRLAAEASPVPVDSRLKAFIDLAATAISNADARAELTASRARVVLAGDDARRRLERDLHDGIQQRLVSLALEVRSAEAMAGEPSDELRAELSKIGDGLAGALDDLREVSRGIHPAILSEGGLGPALKVLARRSAVPIALDVDVDSRLDEHVEVAAYYVVSEALANAAKHAEASVVELQVRRRDGVLVLSIRDDGIGGADPKRGSGLLGLRDRVASLGGTISVASPAGEGTALHVEFPASR
jgi:signal transduction histidine kinase